MKRQTLSLLILLAAISSEPLLLNWEKVGDYQSLRHGHVSAQDINLPANREVVLRNVKGKEHPWFSLPQGVSEADRLQSRRWTPGR